MSRPVPRFDLASLRFTSCSTCLFSAFSALGWLLSSESLNGVSQLQDMLDISQLVFLCHLSLEPPNLSNYIFLIFSTLLFGYHCFKFFQDIEITFQLTFPILLYHRLVFQSSSSQMASQSGEAIWSGRKIQPKKTTQPGFPGTATLPCRPPQLQGPTEKERASQPGKISHVQRSTRLERPTQHETPPQLEKSVQVDKPTQLDKKTDSGKEKGKTVGAVEATLTERSTQVHKRGPRDGKIFYHIF
jgi:hypothetical protein